jgi:TolB-like protein/Flp pilus assembly protein TadD
VSRLKHLIHEIHRRSLWQVLGIYLVGAWVAFQGIEALADGLAMPEWVPGFAVVVMIIGLPIVLATAFVQEGVGAQEAPAEAPAPSEAEASPAPTDEGGLHLVLTWKNVILGGVVVLALAGVGIAGWFLLGVETTRSPETIRSIAVLPLENLTGDPGQEYFADGMTEAVISEFARLGAMNVISRTSVMQYKDARKPLPQIAQELGVQGIVEGSVFRAGDRVRITLQLIDARNDLHLWAQTYERDLSDVLALQSDVARAVAEQIRLELTPEERAALTPSRTVKPQAYDAYLRGLQLRGPPGLVGAWGPSAVERLERAVELDPGLAEGYAALAQVRLYLGILGGSPQYRAEYSKARVAAQKALELDRDLAGAHATLGHVRVDADWDFAGARQAFERALQLSPNDPAALNAYAWYLLQVEGKTEEALDLSERVLRVAPLDLFYRSEQAWRFYIARQYDRALEEVERIRTLDPDAAPVAAGFAYLRLGRLEEAHRAYLAFFERCGAPCEWQREAWERGWAEGGPAGAARAILEVATQKEGTSPYFVASIYARIGETDDAFAWMERGYRERDPQMSSLRSDPRLDPLRSDPRFDDLLRRIGFPEE